MACSSSTTSTRVPYHLFEATSIARIRLSVCLVTDFWRHVDQRCAETEKRRLALPGEIEDWSLTSVQQRLVKTGGRLVKHARYYWLMLAEGHLTRGRFAAMLRRIAILPLPAS